MPAWPSIPGMPRKFGGPDFARERFNSEIISSMIESLIYDSSRRRPASIVSVTGSICRENTYDEFRG